MILMIEFLNIWVCPEKWNEVKKIDPKLWQLENGEDDDQPWDGEYQFLEAHSWLRLSFQVLFVL